MKKLACAAGALSLALSAALMPVAASAQNVAIVNGKGVPKARVDAMMKQITRQGQPVTPELEQQVRDEVVLREIFMQEAEKRGLTGSPEYKQQLELARQNILLRELFVDQQKRNPVTEADIKAEYDKFRAEAGGKEYRARHILVEDEATAKSLIAQLKGGAKFEDLAKKHSKDPGSAASGGDLDWASPGSYVPEFSEAMVKLNKGQVGETPAKSQFGFHVIRVDDVRDAELPSLDEIRPQIEQRLQQQKMAEFQEKLRGSARTDYKFSTN